MGKQCIIKVYDRFQKKALFPSLLQREQYKQENPSALTVTRNREMALRKNTARIDLVKMYDKQEEDNDLKLDVHLKIH